MHDDLNELVRLMYESGYTDPFEAEGGGAAKAGDQMPPPKKAYVVREREVEEDKTYVMYNAFELMPEGVKDTYISTYPTIARAVYDLVKRGYIIGYYPESIDGEPVPREWINASYDWVKAQYDCGEQEQAAADKLLRPR